MTIAGPITVRMFDVGILRIPMLSHETLQNYAFRLTLPTRTVMLFKRLTALGDERLPNACFLGHRVTRSIITRGSRLAE